MNKLQMKMLTFILVPTILFFLALGTYITLTVYSMNKQDAEDHLATSGVLLAEEIGLELEKNIAALESISHTLGRMIEMGNTPSREDADLMLQQLVIGNPNILASWAFWQPNAFDQNDEAFKNLPGHDETGRYIPIWSLEEDGEFVLEPVTEYEDGSPLGLDLNEVFATGEQTIWEPFIYEINNEDVFITSVIVPVIVHGEAVGLTALDIELGTLDAITDEYVFFDTGFASLLSNEGTVISHKNDDLIGHSYLDITANEDPNNLDLLQYAIQEGEHQQIIGFSNTLNRDVYRIFSPVYVNDVQTPWSALIVAPLNEVTKDAKSMMIKISISSFFIISLLVIIISVVTRKITNVVRATVSYGQILERGNFTEAIAPQYLNRNDELGELAHIFTSINENMRNLISKVQESALLVNESAETVDHQTNESRQAAHEVTAAMDKVSDAVDIQLHSAEESARVMNNIAEGVQTVAHSATVVSDTSKQMTEQTIEGQLVVQNAVEQMDTIYKGTNETKVVIEQLETEANEIQTIVSIISDISGQTNLLALNAAIEAARAGDAGSGFAVVAEEVRKLADETNQSTESIQQLIGRIQADTNRAVNFMTNNESGVHEGIERMQEVETVFKQMATSIELIVNEAVELSAIAEEMAAGSEEIAATSNQMTHSAESSSDQTHQVAAAAEQQLASMEEIAASSTKLKNLSEELNRALREFTV